MGCNLPGCDVGWIECEATGKVTPCPMCRPALYDALHAPDREKALAEHVDSTGPRKLERARRLRAVRAAERALAAPPESKAHRVWADAAREVEEARRDLA